MSLHSAAGSGDVDTVKKLIAKGADVNEVNDSGCSPLFYASNSGNITIAGMLIDAGADINIKNSQSQTPLNWAVHSQNEMMVEFLIQKGADIDLKGVTITNPSIAKLIQSSIERIQSLDKRMSNSSISSSKEEDGNSKKEAMKEFYSDLGKSGTYSKRATSTPEMKRFSVMELARSNSISLLPRSSSLNEKAFPEDPPTLRFLHQLSQLQDSVELEFSSVTSLEVSLVPLASQTKEVKSNYQSLVKRKILGEFLVKRGGMRTNWKCRYFLLTGDHIHYFEPRVMPKSSEVSLLEPLPNATPIGSISLHTLSGKVHKSDLGIVFCFQIPTPQRTYHVKAPSARSIERWMSVLNGNVKRIQMASSRFDDTVFRIVTQWKDNPERAVLRNGREFLTLDLIIRDHFPNVRITPLPIKQLEDPNAMSKDQLALLVDYIKQLFRTKDPKLTEQVSKFITDQGAEFFAVESRRELIGIETGQFDISLSNPISAVILSGPIKESSKLSHWLLCSEYNQNGNHSNIHLYDYAGSPIPAMTRKLENPIQGKVLAIHFCPDTSYFATTIFNETRKPAPGEQGVGSIKIGALETQIWNPNTFELLLTLNSTEIIFDRDLIYCAQDCLDTTAYRKQGESTQLVAKILSPKSLSIYNVAEKSLFKNLNFDLKSNDKLNVVRFHPRDPSVLAIGTDQVTQIWDIIKEEILVNLKHPCVSLAFSLDGKKFAGVGPFKSKIKCWEVRTGKVIKKLAAGFSTPKDDGSLHYQPHVSFNPRSNQILVVSSFGDVILWNFELEQGDETQTIMNIEHNLELETVPENGAANVSEMVMKKAKLLEPAVIAGCKGCTLLLTSKANAAKFSNDGLVVLTYSQVEKKIVAFLSRNGDLVTSFNLESEFSSSQFASFEISPDGRQITYAHGNNLITRPIPVDKNGDIQTSIEDHKDEVEEKFIEIGWVPRHIENDPMIPHYEHLLIIAILENNSDKVKKIARTNNLNVNYFSVLDGWSPLTLACKFGYHKIVQSLIKCGADVSFSRRSDNMRPIHAAASSGDLKTVLALIEHGANPNVTWDPQIAEPGKKIHTNISPIHIAAVNGFAEILEALLNCGANIEAKDSNNKTPIIYAASNKDNVAAVQVLVRRGADCTARGRTGTTALHEASKNDSQKMVMLLLKEGAEAENDRNSRGETPVDINPHLFSKKKYEPYLRSDTKAFLKYQLKMKTQSFVK